MEDKKSDEKQIVVFNLGNEEFGIDIARVNSIVKVEKITEIPNTENYIEGVINLRGKIVVTINLDKKFGVLEKKQDKDTRIIIVEFENEMMGIMVDAVCEVLRLEKNSMQNTPKDMLEKIHAEYIDGVIVSKNRLIMILDVDKVIRKSDIEQAKKINGK